MNESDEEFKKALLSSPIHQRVSIQLLMDAAKVPTQVHRTVHELLIVRGRYPMNLSEVECNEFTQKAMEIHTRHNLPVIYAEIATTLMAGFVRIWLEENNPNL